MYTTSEDEDELSRLKPTPTAAITTTAATEAVNTTTTAASQLPATPSAAKSTKGQRGHRTGQTGLGRNYYLGPPMAGGSGATSPNDSDNTYAEASLLAHVRYEHNNPDGSGQNLRYDQGNILLYLYSYPPITQFLILPSHPPTHPLPENFTDSHMKLHTARN